MQERQTSGQEMKFDSESLMGKTHDCEKDDESQRKTEEKMLNWFAI